MNYTITAISTNYKGYDFRSRLEARRAVFLDALGGKWADWRYEDEGFQLSDGTKYLPDFYLPSIGNGIYMEVKPRLLTLQRTDPDFNKIAQFVIETRKDVWLCAGLEHVPDNIIFYTGPWGVERTNYWVEELRKFRANPEKETLAAWASCDKKGRKRPSAEEIEKEIRFELDAAIKDGDKYDYEINDALPQPNGTFSYGLNPHEPEWGWNSFWDRAFLKARGARFEY